MGYWLYAVSVFYSMNVILLFIALSPFPPAKMWNKLFSFWGFSIVRENLWNFYLLTGFLASLTFLDSIISMRKYKTADYNLSNDPLIRKDDRIGQLIAQRNCYLSGGCIVISILVPRIFAILKDNVTLSKRTESVKHAAKAFKALLGVMDVEKEYNDDDADHGSESRDLDNAKLKDVLKEAIRRELETMKEKKDSSSDVSGMTRRELEELIRQHEENRRRRKAKSKQTGPPDTRFLYQPRLRNEEHTRPTEPVRQPRPGTRFGLF